MFVFAFYLIVLGELLGFSIFSKKITTGLDSFFKENHWPKKTRMRMNIANMMMLSQPVFEAAQFITIALELLQVDQEWNWLHLQVFQDQKATIGSLYKLTFYGTTSLVWICLLLSLGPAWFKSTKVALSLIPGGMVLNHIACVAVPFVAVSLFLPTTEIAVKTVSCKFLASENFRPELQV